VRRRFAPHQPRHAHAVELAREGVPLNVIQRQLGHPDLSVTSVYLQGIDNAEIINTIHARHTRERSRCLASNRSPAAWAVRILSAQTRCMGCVAEMRVLAWKRVSAPTRPSSKRFERSLLLSQRRAVGRDRCS
jgi:hypothetical protein